MVAFKISRSPGRTKLVAARAPFTAAPWSLALTVSRQAGAFEPLPGDVTFVPYGDAEALARVVDADHRRGVPRADHGEAGRHTAPVTSSPRVRSPQRTAPSGPRRGQTRRRTGTSTPTTRRDHTHLVTRQSLVPLRSGACRSGDAAAC